MESKLRFNTTTVFTLVGLFFLYATSVFAFNGGIAEKSVSPSASSFLAPSVIVSDNFAGSTPTYVSPYQSPNFTGATGLSANGIAKGAGVTGVSATGSYSTYHWDGGSLGTAQANNDYYEWVITPQAGKEIDFNQLVLEITRGNNGNSPKDFVLLASTAANFGSPVSLGTITPGNVASATLTYNNVTAFASLQNVKTAITFRLYGYNGGTNANGTFNVLSYAFTGEVFDLPTFGSVSQEAVVCEGTPTATIVLTGLLPNSVSTISYTIAGGAIQTATGVVADGSGTATFPLLLEVGNDSQTLAITTVLRTDLIGVSPLTPNTNNTVVLGIDPLLTWYLDADNDSYYVGTPIIACYSPGEGYNTTATIAGDCNDADVAVNPGASEVCFDNIDNNCDGSLFDGCPLVVTALEAVHSNQNLPQIGTTLRAVNPNYVGPYSDTLLYRFRVTNLSTEAVETVTSDVRAFQLIMFSPGFFTFETSYSIEVAVVINGEEQPYGIARTVTTPSVPTIQVSSTFCGGTLAAIDTRIYVEQVNSATLYRFKISKVGLAGDERFVEREFYGFKLHMVPTTPGEVGYVSYNSSYLVSVQARVVIGGQEVWSDYGAVCTVTTPDLPTTFIADTYCDLEVSDINQRIYATWFSGATQYRFLLEEVMAGEGDEDEIILYSQTQTKNKNYFTLNMFTGLQLGVTYRVRVALGFNGEFGPYGVGEDCSVTYVTAVEPEPLMRTTEDTTIASTIHFSAMAYPNPFNNSFNLDVKGIQAIPVQITVYDMMGRLLESTTITVDQANNTSIGTNYPKGVYNVVVTQGEEVKMIRVIKQ